VTICWIFAGITLAASLVATFVGDIRRAILSLWVAGLGIGGIYLTLGAELLAIVQWIVSTLVAISFVFFSVMFGEYVSSEKAQPDRRLVKNAMGITLGAVFAGLIWFGGGHFQDDLLIQPSEGTDMVAIGKTLTQEHLLSLEVLALTLFMVLVGGGVIARPDETRRRPGGAS
jgi:NADH:ubiquinone oxidoreductase subunit 6 (subunit J)